MKQCFRADMFFGASLLICVLSLSGKICCDENAALPLSLALDALPDSCLVLQKRFSALFSNYMRCAMGASRPLTLCLDCMHLRWPLDQALAAIQNDSECADVLLRDEAVLGQLVPLYTSLLERSHCHLCEVLVNSTSPSPSSPTADEAGTTDQMKYVPAEVVLNYLETQEHFVQCAKASNGSRDAVCSVCRELYVRSCQALKLCVGDPADWNTCRDVIDKANSSMRLWEEAGCVQEPVSFAGQATMLGTALASVLLVLFFYGGVYRLGGRPRPPAHSFIDATTPPPPAH